MEWEAETNLRRMLAHVGDERESRLIICACAREVWILLSDHRCRKAVETAEKYAMGDATAEELGQAKEAAFAAYSHLRHSNVARCRLLAASAVYDCCMNPLQRGILFEVSLRRVWSAELESEKNHTCEIIELKQCDIVRDIVPYHPDWMKVAPQYLLWQDGVISRLANKAWEGRNYTLLPIIADAVEESGCANEHLLNHLRSPKRHWHGCWALRALLEEKNG